MATLHIHIPDELKKNFQETFAGEDADQLLTRMVEEAIEDRKRIQKRKDAVRGILELRKRAPAVSEADVEDARHWGRP
jgi:predicted transcriptional regulator